MSDTEGPIPEVKSVGIGKFERIRLGQSCDTRRQAYRHSWSRHIMIPAPTGSCRSRDPDLPTKTQLPLDAADSAALVRDPAPVVDGRSGRKGMD